MTPNSFLLIRTLGKGRTIAALFSLLVLCSLLFTACGGTNTTKNASGKKVLKIAAQSYDFAQAGFNPYNGHPNAGIGLVYETLYFVNVNGGSFTPMLATSYKWNSDNTQVTFTIRPNVKWNDGKPFSADIPSSTRPACRCPRRRAGSTAIDESRSGPRRIGATWSRW